MGRLVRQEFMVRRSKKTRSPAPPKKRRVRSKAAARPADEIATLKKELRAARTLLRDVVDSISVGFCVYDRNDRLVLCNQRYKDTYPKSAWAMAPGTSFEDILRAGVEGGDYPDAVGREEAWIAERMRIHNTPGKTVEQRRQNGRWVLITDRHMRGGGIAGLRIDITDLKQAEADAEAARQRMADFAEASNDWFWEADAAGNVTYVSEPFELATGIPSAKRLGGLRLDLNRSLDPDNPNWDAHLKAVAAREAFRDFVMTVRFPTGIKHMSISGKPLFDADIRFIGYRGTSRDVTQQTEADRVMAAQTRLLSLLIENLPIGVSLVGPDLRFLAFNRPFTQMIGLAPGFLSAGDPMEKVVRFHAERGYYGAGDTDALVQERLQELRDMAATSYEQKTLDGRTMDVRRIPLPDGGVVVMRVDVTEARERERALQAANAAKTSFLANMSHELRTPLNAILGFSEVIKNEIMGPVSERYRDYAGDIYASGNYLLHLIDDVLDHAKIEVGRLTLHETRVDLAALVTECARLLEDKARDGSLTLSLEIPGDMPALRVDRVRLKQVLLNLVSNAVKFTPPGGHIAVSAERRPDGLTITIADTGIGMRREEIPLALELFRQIDNTLSRRYEGTGLGLPLAKRLTELHGGELSLESTPGKGTRAQVWLPAERLVG